jgi:hypothetical protein
LPSLPLPLLRLLWALPELLPPLLEAPGEFEIAAARDLFIPSSQQTFVSLVILDSWSMIFFHRVLL